MTYNEKKSLYESIMKEVAKTVKRLINELSLPLVRNAWKKSKRYGSEIDTFEQTHHIKYNITEKLSIIDRIEFDVRLSYQMNDNYPYEYTIEFYKGKNIYPLASVSGIASEDSLVSMRLEDWDDSLNCIDDDEDNLKSVVDAEDLVHILTRYDARKFADAINTESGLNLNYRNFLCTGFIPEELKEN